MSETREWKIIDDAEFDRNGDYKIVDEYGETVLVDTSYYPSAPSYTQANFIVEAVNFYLKHAPQPNPIKQEKTDE